ncbi:lipoate--protein ligase family protein [Haloferax volcanii]|uniref:Lipoate--protein ligase domain protein n=3 Tax=Haloferax volcanii TaxID=2246 RepID=D4GSG7_HALVD|nr:biotin/lipoate A/B protein ligase family protein [Haloferax volcanii]ADE05054.1 lipoate--protein ligase domain protein [Haloferax volcanii DS2]ELY26167.1 biotin/lipoate A/B protein ligase [Haloferax volcanii DS2]MBS8121053.1 lipoate--protein ligase family protein [Haloferax volcanii]MBS8124884.1 lipoate--protein ligase family protein [Haloferax volcanii]MBS8128947.1 lipoate--protein ligase family protein [Haloferax volcanii]
MNDSQGSIADREWRVIREEVRPGPMQMALDEVAGETAAAGGPRTVRVYSWVPSCLSLGYGQDPETVDWDYCDREGIDVTRRQTGGGGIYHDRHGDVAYSIAAPKSELPGDLMDCYHLLCEPILDAIRAVGVDVNFVDDDVPVIWHPACYLRALHPAHDMVAAGRKVAGNAQYRRRDAVVQHGSLTYSVDAETHLGVFEGHDVTPEAFRERVVGIDELADASREAFVAALTESLSEFVDAEEGAWTDDELDRAREKVDEKYRADDWVRRRPGSRSD